jgi:hypothetical protein
MKTTLDIRDDLLAEAKAMAARQHTTLTRMVEEGLALRLRAQAAATSRAAAVQLPPLPVSKRRGGLLPGIDGASNRSMLEAADGE